MSPIPRPTLEISDRPASMYEDAARFFGHARDLLLIVEKNGRILLASPSIERLLGLGPEDVADHSFLRWIHPSDRATVVERARRLEPDAPIEDMAARIRAADGRWVDMSWTVTTGGGDFVYAVGRDRTEFARRQEAVLGQRMAELKLQTAVELHDGVLQSLTAASLQIAVARRLTPTDPDAAIRVLDGLLDSLQTEQRELRVYVDEIRDSFSSGPPGEQTLRHRIERMIDNIGTAWGVRTRTEVDLPDGLSAEQGRQILRISQEATVNAIRHGGARSVTLAIESRGPVIQVEVEDDGGGFSVFGEFGSEELDAGRIGPVSLKHRVKAMGGGLSIRSSPSGSRVTASLPIVAAGGA